MTKKQVLRVTAFLLILLTVLFVLNEMFELENNTLHSKRYYTFRTLNENTVDTIFFGTSGIDRYWIASQGYEDYGITSFPLSTDGFPSWLYPYVIDQALATQQASLIILDIRPFTQGVLTRNMTGIDAISRTVLDILPAFSVNRAKAAFKTMEIMHQVSLQKAEIEEDTTEKVHPRFNISYLFSFIRYHEMWEKDNYKLSNHFGNTPHLYGGFYMSKPHVLRVQAQKSVYNSDEIGSLDPICEQALYDVIAHVKKKNLNVLFLDTPQCHTETECHRANAVYRILEQEKMDYVHFYDAKSKNGFSIDLDIKTDFQDSGHVNFYGATKFTESFSRYLKENYDLPDRRQDKLAAADWDGVQDKLLDQIKVITDEKKESLESDIKKAEKAQTAADRLSFEIKEAENIKK